MGIKDSALSIAIIIMTLFVVVYGVHTFYPSPEYENFCDSTREFVGSMEECSELEGKWTTYDGPKPVSVNGFCDQDFYCRAEYDAAREKYSRNLFFITLPLGILIIASGAYFFSLGAVGAGLMGGGIGTLLYGVLGYWSYGDDWLKFILSLIGLGLLIWFSYWLNDHGLKKKKRK